MILKINFTILIFIITQNLFSQNTSDFNNKKECVFYLDLPMIGVKEIKTKKFPYTLKANFMGYPALLKFEDCSMSDLIDIKVYTDIDYSTIVAEGCYVVKKEKEQLEILKIELETLKEVRKVVEGKSAYLDGSWHFYKFQG